MTILVSASHPSVLADNTVSIDNCYSYQEDLSISSQVSTTSSWGDHANLQFEITNTGEKTIHNWFVSFNLPYEIEGIWGANLIEHANNMYTVMNGGHNMDILPNQKVSFGMTVKSTDGSAVSDIPTFMFLNTNTFELELSSLSVNTQLYSDWGQGCNGSLTLKSNVDFPIMDWTIRFSSNRPITEVSNAILTQDEDGSYTLSNNGNNANIEGHSSLPLTFNGGEGTGLQLTLLSVRTITYPIMLTQDENNNGIADILERVGQGQQQDDPDIDLELDTDGDGVPDYYEKQLGTDPNSKDSDNDGIEDGVEVALGMDPLSADSDGDGIPDSQEDDDSDGLTLAEEIEHETYTWTDDSDVDGISDGEEIHMYGTDPLNEDTDGDGIEDGDELKLGLSPTSNDSDGDGIPDGQERFPQVRSEVIEDTERPVVNKVEVSLTGTGCLGSAMTIKDMYNEDSYCSDLVSLVGVPVSIEYEGSFDEATITFHYDETKLSTESMNLEDSTCDEEFREEDLGILWYDEESGLFVDCGATVDTNNNTVSCQTTHFSEYMLYWKVAWNYRWTYELQRHGQNRATNPDSNGLSRGIDYVLCVQYDDTMSSEQLNAQTEIVYQFIDNLRPFDRIQFVDWSMNWVFGNYTQNGWDPINDKAELKSIYESISSYCPSVSGMTGSGEVSWLFIAPHLDNRIKFLDSHEIVSVIFQNKLSYSYSGRAAMLADGIKKLSGWGYPSTYLFELPDSSYSSDAISIFNANSRGGLIDCDRVENPYDEFCRLYLLNQGADGDKDGLLDIAEDKGMVGTNGTIYHSDPEKPNSDKDSVPDREEMGAEIKLSVDDHGNVTVDGEPVYSNDTNYLTFAGFGQGDWVIYSVISDPSETDTDGDHANDGEDATPRRKNGTINYILIGKDNPGEDSLSRMRQPYINAFKAKDKNVVVIDIWENSPLSEKVKVVYDELEKDFYSYEVPWYVLNHLTCDLEKEQLSEKIAYSSVESCVIIAHGNNENSIDFDCMASDVTLRSEDVLGKLTQLCEVRFLDIQVCFTGRDGYHRGLGRTCIAKEFAKHKSVSVVFAWSGKTGYKFGYCYSTRFWGDDYGTYNSFSDTASGVVVTSYGDRFPPLPYFQ